MKARIFLLFLLILGLVWMTNCVKKEDTAPDNNDQTLIFGNGDCDCALSEIPMECESICNSTYMTLYNATFIIRGRGCKLPTDCFPDSPTLNEFILKVLTEQPEETEAAIVNSSNMGVALPTDDYGGSSSFDSETGMTTFKFGWVDSHIGGQLYLSLKTVIKQPDGKLKVIELQEDLGMDFFAK